MEYKDALGIDIKVGDHIVYYSEYYGMQLGKVLELTSAEGYRTMPALKIQGARASRWGNKEADFKKLPKPSKLTKLQNVVVLNNNLNAIVTLM